MKNHNTLRNIWVIAINTFRETVRDKILYSILAFGVLSIGASLLAGSVSLGQDVRVVQDFGLTAMFVFLLIITIFIGTQLVYREVDRRTIYQILPKPISREAFYLGKYLGLCLTILTTGLIMGAMFVGMVYFKAHSINVAALIAIVGIIIEMWLVTAIGIFFSTFASPIASAIYTFCLVLIGHSSHTVSYIAAKSGNDFLRYALKGVYYIFPNLEKFNFRNEVVYNLAPSFEQISLVILYFALYSAVLILLGLAIFRRDEF